MSKPRKEKRDRQWEAPVIIAFVAVLISSASTFISLRETKILTAQQQTMVSQQEASVWPYLENNIDNSFKDDSIAIFKYEVTNKGVGPAIVGEVDFYFDEQLIEHWELFQNLRERYPTLKISQMQNASLEQAVIAPGETRVVVTERIVLPAGDTSSLSSVVSEINRLYKLQYCYCSVYGKCWFVKSSKAVERSEDCEFRADIR